MRDLFKKRRQDFLASCIKYSRYVLNDHFILFFLVFLGFLALQYRELLLHLPKEKGLLYVFFFFFLLLVISLSGGRASYVEEPDKHYLLPQEGAVIEEVKKGQKRSLLFWGLLHSFLYLVLIPLGLALGFSPIWLAIFLVLSLLVKLLYFRFKERQAIPVDGLDWDGEIAREEARKQRILRFFSLFTNVKGISNSIKPRAYLNPILKVFPLESKHTWSHLYLRSFFRNGELFQLTIRLFFLSLAALLLIDQALVSLALASLLNYLLLFQLLGLWTAYDYQYLTLLYPLDPSFKKRGLAHLLGLVFLTMFSLEALLALRYLGSWPIYLAFVLINLALLFLYLPYRLRGLVDERA